jgi:hypothetical protein
MCTRDLQNRLNPLTGLQITAKTFKKVKDFNQTPYDYESIDLDYKSLKGLQKVRNVWNGPSKR